MVIRPPDLKLNSDMDLLITEKPGKAVHLPLVVAELVAVVITRDDVNKQDVFGFGIHPAHLHLVAWKHSPVCKGDSVLENR